MLRAAQGLVKDQNPAISEDENQIIGEFTTRFYDTQLFWDKYAGGKFAEYLFKAREFVRRQSRGRRPRRATAAGSAVIYRRGARLPQQASWRSRQHG